MYVFRPQQSHVGCGYAPSCGQHGRPWAGGRRYAKKAQTRALAKRQRTLNLPARRRTQLKDHESGSTPGGSREARASPVPSAEAEKRSAVRERLRARLVDRSARELVMSLTRRHGDGWPAHVLQGGFNSDEEMRRICEAFGLRPDLERQVLRNAIERAKSWKPEMAPVKELPLKMESPRTCCSKQKSRSRQEDSAAAIPFLAAEHGQDASEPESDGNFLSASSAVSSVLSVPSPQSSRPSSPTGSSASRDEQDLESDDAESLGWVTLDSAVDLQSHSMREAPKLWHARWRTRVIRTLGLDRWWPSKNECPQVQPEIESHEVTGVMHQGGSLEEVLAEAGLAGLVDGEQDDEDMAISSKLITAMLNAERQADATRSDLHDVHGCDLFGSCSPEAKGRSKRRRPPEVRFDDGSQVSFFNLMDDTGNECEIRNYQRSLQTKDFDGPSGHKARRAGMESSEEESDSDDDEEDWEDRCDDIAELMSRQRTMLLWSNSW
mmetsp:Transcript_98230/g.174896  ORF Transcript_98230/g.174896 Transcript_98230/m.174896 type:complete len:493 (-) Transcript_98230:109-1587(-)